MMSEAHDDHQPEIDEAEEESTEQPEPATYRPAPWRTKAQATSLVLAGVIIVTVIGALYLAQASRTAAAGRRLQALERERQQLELKNADLRAEIAALQSIPRLIREAEARGYRPAGPDDVYYMQMEGAPPAEPTPAPPPQEIDLPEYDETLDSWLGERFDTFSTRLTGWLTRAEEQPDAGE